MAALAPRPSPRVRMATRAKPGARRRLRKAWRTSRRRSSRRRRRMGAPKEVFTWMRRLRKRLRRAPLRASLLATRFHHDGRTVTQDFRDPVHHLVRVIANAGDRVGPGLLGMLEHQLEGLLARLLAESNEVGDPAAYDGLETGPDEPDHRSGAHRNTHHHAEGLDD